MNLFVLTLFPISLYIFYAKKEKDNRAHFLTIIFTGLFTGVLFLAYKLLFSSFYNVPQANIFVNFVYYLFFQELIPCTIIFGIFFLFARKDSIQDRLSYFFPIITSFYSVYLPYIILETQKPYPAFLLFVKPLMFLAMFIIVHIWIQKFLEPKKNNKELAINISVVVGAFFIPALTESLWVVNVFALLWGILAAALIGYAILLIIPKKF